MEKVLIIGSNGAGKSTFSFSLAEGTGLPLIHIDQIYWCGNWQVTPQAEFDQLVLAEALKPSWIIEGNNIRSLPGRLQHADTVFWFEFPPLICIKNILIREWRYRGAARPDMPEGCKSRLSLKFLLYACRFNRRNRKNIAAMLEKVPHVQVIRFTGRRQVAAYLHSLNMEG